MLLTTCAEPGCETLVLGGRCVEHDLMVTRAFVRGRPFVRSHVGSATLMPAPRSIRRGEVLRVGHTGLERTPT